MKNKLNYRVIIATVVVTLLTIFFAEKSFTQTFTQISSYPFVVTQVKYDSIGNEYVIRQQGELLKNHQVIKNFPVMFRNECGLVGFDLAPDGFVLHISGKDSIQRILYLDTTDYIIDTLLEVHYDAPFSDFHRGGGIVYRDSVLYCTFGVGQNNLDAQNLENFRGKFIKIPQLPNGTWGIEEIVEHGLRNSYRFAFRNDINEGFISDAGSTIAEELNYVTENYSFVNQGWPCYEGTVQLLPDSLCDGYALSFPEYTYSQAQPRVIIGGCYYDSNYYFCDHYSGFGGYLDTSWTFHPMPISPVTSEPLKFPVNVTSMTINPLTNKLVVSTWIGKIYELDETPLSIDEDTVPKEENIQGITYYANRFLAWDPDLVGQLSIYNIQGQLIELIDLEDDTYIMVDSWPIGIYILVIKDEFGFQWVRKIVKY